MKRPLPARLNAAVAVAAALGAAAGAIVAVGVPGGVLDRYAVATPAGDLVPTLLAGFGIVVLAQVAGLRVRAGEGHARLAWGEAAIVVVCAGLPTALVPVVVLA